MQDRVGDHLGNDSGETIVQLDIFAPADSEDELPRSWSRPRFGRELSLLLSLRAGIGRKVGHGVNAKL